MSDYEDQDDELLALTSIYDEETISVSRAEDSDIRRGSVSVEVEIPQPFRCAVKHIEGTEHAVLHLPCIVLDFTLPHDYPSVRPPNFTLTCPWLSDFELLLLTTELEKLWANNCGSVILFTWIGFLQTETIAFLNIKSPLLLSEHKLPIVLDYDRTKCDRVFAGTMFSCQVCLCEKPGSACMQFWGCDHVFCKGCLRDYFEVHIKDGSISLLKCPEDKCGIQAHPTQVKELVSSELFERYDRLLLQLSLDTMNDIVYCPRKDCASPVVVDKDSAMGSCAACHYVFCIYCQMVYHGVAVCKMKSEAAQKIREAYLSGNDQDKQELEKKYGQKQLKKLVEEHFSEQWLQENSKKCPRCFAQVQKIDGCNKMTCSKCHSYFCWLCLSVLQSERPYDHFNKAPSSCLGGLFRGVEVDDEEDNIDEFLNAMRI